MAEKDKQTKPAGERNYGIDLLRLAAMFMVLCLHVYGHGGILDRLPRLSVGYEAVWMVEFLCICCLNCYMLISGYVGVKGRYRYANLAVLWLRALFYSVLITAAAQILVPAGVSKRDWLQAFFPVLFDRYWFFTAYFLVFLLMPVLNAATRALTKKQLGSVICGLLVFLSVFPTLLHVDPFYTNFGSGALWFSLAYLIGAYVRLYGLLREWSRGRLALLYLGSCLVMWGFKLAVEWRTARIGNHLMVHVSPFVLLAAVALLLLFERMRFSERCRKLISALTPLAFSVYLIHEHPLFRTHVIGRLSFLGELPLPLMMLSHLAIVLALYVFCLAVDFLRERLFRVLKIGKRLRALEERKLGGIWDPF